ncbi:MAG: cytochrome c oxidase subunit 3 [Armatimonadota bacterium]|nr:cytochrome c oxidase subunit 3 [Armatimonadota bacterium]MDR7402149.1 cytochrome c oxidase subunit 3 [Armatimonadota bacterium]MDR7404907.1 cytochrome c oxidase subunit 3 [Armatimonadota bacterium]MDR7436906.1 cytochrome c oxidase subunit 3 [Armatimonadota bacterium]MDR7472320.1 cytochrome c oxidase subunit 3 [Armatimonadota bacterium]
MSRAPQILDLPRVPPPPRAPERGDRGPGEDGPAGRPAHPARVAVWLVVAAVVVLFAAFTSTYLARRAEPDWTPAPMPRILWASTTAILASSLILSASLRAGRRGRRRTLRRGLAATAVLGGVFLICQLLGWRDLARAGVFLASSPHSAFFYLLTGTHGLHLAGGLGALLYALARSGAPAERVLDVAEPAATYWHSLAGLWVYVFVILFGL